MDVFVEPVLPRPSLVVFGASQVALALAAQARPLGFNVTLAAPFEEIGEAPEADQLVDGFAIDADCRGERYLVVSTQGRGDEAALKAAAAAKADYIGFVGSHRKMAALKQELDEVGIAAEALDRVKGPAGLDLGAITPEEIALSILAEIITLRRRGQRGETAPQV